MGHCYSVVGAAGAHVVYDNRRGVVVCHVPDLLPVRAVPRSHQGHPGCVAGHRREPDVGVARLPVLLEGRHQHQTPGLSLGGVLAVAAALALFRPHLLSDGVLVGDVDERRVPLLFLCHGEVQAQQVDEAERQQPRRESQTAARSDEGRCHCDGAASLGWVMSSPGLPRTGELKPSSPNHRSFGPRRSASILTGNRWQPSLRGSLQSF